MYCSISAHAALARRVLSSLLLHSFHSRCLSASLPPISTPRLPARAWTTALHPPLPPISTPISRVDSADGFSGWSVKEEMWIRSKRRWIRTEEARGGTGKCWSYVRLRCSILQSLRSIYNLFDFIDFMSRSKRRSGCDRYGEWEALTDAALGFFLELLLTLSDVLSWWGSANQRRRRMIGSIWIRFEVGEPRSKVWLLQDRFCI